MSEKKETLESDSRPDSGCDIPNATVMDYVKGNIEKSKKLLEMEKHLNLSNKADWAVWDALPLTESDRIDIIKSYLANPEEWVTPKEPELRETKETKEIKDC